MAYGTIADVLALFKEAGLFAFYLPFLLVFTIIYALLLKTGIFGRERAARVVNLVVSLIASLYVVGYTPIGVTLAGIIASMFSGAFILLLTVLVVVLVFVFVFPALLAIGGRAPTESQWLHRFIMWGIFLFVIAWGISLVISSGGASLLPPFPFGTGGTTTPTIVMPGLTLQDIAIIVLVIFTGLIIWWMSQPEKKEK